MFLSPTRGLVIYNADTDEFSYPVTKDEMPSGVETSVVSERLLPNANVHTVFGDTYLLLEIMKKTGMIDVINETFSDKVFLQRFLCHALHGILKDGSRITCDDFIAKLFVSYIAKDIPLESLKSDTVFFSVMGADRTKLAFFRSYIKYMRLKYPDFGKACFVDFTPLPNDIDSPFSALCSHGIAATAMRMRLVLVLDETSLRPIWVDIIPGNVLDINTLKHITKDVEISLAIHLNGFILDAGYASKELIQSFEIQGTDDDIPEKNILCACPQNEDIPIEAFIPRLKTCFLKRNMTSSVNAITTLAK